VLVTGASGFIGSALCARLVGEGAEVHGVARELRLDGADGVSWWQADLAALDQTRQLFADLQPRTVFHLAGHVMGDPEVAAVAPTLEGNLLTTVNVLTCAAEGSAPRVVLAGSQNERKAEAMSPYAVSKWAASRYAAMFHTLHGVPVVTLRVYMAYGPGQRDLAKLVPYVTTALLRGEAPRLASGSRRVDWIYVDDVVDALVRGAAKPGVEGRTFEVASGGLVTIRDTVRRLHAHTGAEVQPVFGARDDGPADEVALAGDPAETTAVLGWRPTVGLDEGLRRTVQWYRERILSGVL
jgi:UDP-glucose 4-epimerase